MSNHSSSFYGKKSKLIHVAAVGVSLFFDKLLPDPIRFQQATTISSINFSLFTFIHSSNIDHVFFPNVFFLDNSSHLTLC